MFFFYCTACQHPAQNAGNQRHGQPAPMDIWEMGISEWNLHLIEKNWNVVFLGVAENSHFDKEVPISIWVGYLTYCLLFSIHNIHLSSFLISYSYIYINISHFVFARHSHRHNCLCCLLRNNSQSQISWRDWKAAHSGHGPGVYHFPTLFVFP